MSRTHTFNMPSQRLPMSKKTKEWRKDNVDSGDKHSFYNNESVRQSLKNKIINYRLYDGIVDIQDLVSITNPYHQDASFIPDNIPHQPILVPKVDLLLGEEIKRRFDWRVIVSNSDAVSKKEDDKKKELKNRLVQFITSNYPEEEQESRFQELEDFMKYDWQDLREKMANQILRYYYQAQDFESKFNNGFKDALLVAEEMYSIDIVHNEPVLERLNPLKVHTVRSGKSSKIEDSNLIILEDHWSPGKIIDYYHDELKPADIDYISDYNNNSKSSGGNYSDDHDNHVLLRDGLGAETVNNFLNVAEVNGHYFSSNYTDENGNVRVLKVLWKSIKKIKKIKFYTEDGETEYKIMSEEYIPNKMLGEEETILWVNEWWEGTKIGKDIYVNMRPKKVQYNKLENPSKCSPGIIGQVYNTNQGRAVSLVDRMKNYQYMYDAIWDRVNKAIASNYGKIMELDLAKVPEGWEMEKWLHFATVNKIAIIDSFKEGNKGAATGKLAGGMNTQGGRVMDMETGNYIQQHIQLLEFIKNEMSEIAGVSKQREGAIHQNETAQGVERSVNQSSHITEFWFSTHDNVKLRVMECFLETAKIALRGQNKKVQYILDDQTIELLNMDGDLLSEADYGLLMTSSSKTQELEQLLKSNAQAFVQNGGSLSTIIDIYFSPSIADMRRKLEIAEEKVNTMNAKASEDQNKLAMQAQEQMMQLEQSKLELDNTKNERDNETKRYIAELKSELDSNIDESDDGILDNEKLELDKQKHKDDLFTKIKSLDNDMKKHYDKMKREDKKIAVSKQKPTSK